ncbi:MAG: hypothetical protein LBS88_06715 [Tannerellaceae bacterium]|jgi:hypothetical protein|nr:hypothetical protein [Tannerellaceae bacterium]
MIKKPIAGIWRGSRFSPNHVGNDAAIFSLTAKELRKRGCIVNEYPESVLKETDIEEMFIFNMVRGSRPVAKLQQYEDEGRIVINSAYGINNCTRENMTCLLLSNRIPYPRSLIVRTDTDPLPLLREASFHNCWIKRGDFHAIHREDVTYVRNPGEAQSILEEYAIRGIKNAVINEHLTGDLVKFYGVKETDFFYWFYPSCTQHSKFGLEQINGAARGIPFDPVALQTLCNRAAGVLNIQVFGGDCIIPDDGSSLRIIDFNDWPSFAPCRNEAAPYIAGRIYSLIQQLCPITI